MWEMVECVKENHGRLFGTPLKLLFCILKRVLRTARLFLYECQNMYLL